MTPLTGKDLYLADHLKLLQQPIRNGNGWVDSLRKRGLERFVALGFPTSRDEAWRQTNLTGLVKTGFASMVAKPADPPAAGLLKKARYAGLQGPEAVFHNGRLVGISGTENLPRGVLVLDLAQAVGEQRELLAPHLAMHAAIEQHSFVALNTAFMEQGLVVLIPSNAVLETPIHVIHISDPGDEGHHTHPRLLVHAGDNAQATLVETWVGNDATAAAYFNNPVAEFIAGRNATIHHVKVQWESRSAYHIASTQYYQAQGSQVHSHVINIGGALVRNELGATLDGEQAHCTLNGLYLTKGKQHVDNHTRLDHAKPHCTSHEAYKGILDDQSSGVFTGRILVRPDAQKTDAIQRNRALLLTPTATINSQPQLEIFADDVRCTHGATIGQLNEDALFYLRARGIDRDAARGLLTYAFANEIIEQIPVVAVRDQLEHQLARDFNIIQDEPTAGKGAAR